MCEICSTFEVDSKSLTIRYITGHHPNCPDFTIDVDKFISEFETHVELTSSRKFLKELPKIIESSKLEDLNDEKMKSSSLTRKLYTYLFSKYYPIAPNVYIYNWESDLLAINKETGYITEYEIKISRADFKADFKKNKKHEMLEKSFKSKNEKDLPNHFYYVTSPGLLDKSEIPSYAGLIEIGSSVRFLKRAPILHKNKIDNGFEIQLLTKVYYKYWNKL